MLLEALEETELKYVCSSFSNRNAVLRLECFNGCFEVDFTNVFYKALTSAYFGKQIYARRI